MSIFKKVNRLLFLVFIKKIFQKNHEPFKNHCIHGKVVVHENNAEFSEPLKSRETKAAGAVLEKAVLDIFEKKGLIERHFATSP
jgi:hypothetical protein